MLDEWIDYLLNALSDDFDDDEAEDVVRHAIREANQAFDIDDEDAVPPEATRELIRIALEHVEAIKMRQRRDDMMYARRQFEELRLLARVGSVGAEISILRQGFILLMTAFDAAVFDVAKIAFRKRFFDFVKVVGKDDKIRLSEVGEAGTIDAFAAQTVDTQLKRRYLKDVLMLLEQLGVSCVDQSRGNTLGHLIEMVLRRNAHVHNRGVVDEHYIEADVKTGKPKFNLYLLNLGETADIDTAYWQKARQLCGHCVRQLVAWTEQ